GGPREAPVRVAGRVVSRAARAGLPAAPTAGNAKGVVAPPHLAGLPADPAERRAQGAVLAASRPVLPALRRSVTRRGPSCRRRRRSARPRCALLAQRRRARPPSVWVRLRCGWEARHAAAKGRHAVREERAPAGKGRAPAGESADQLRKSIRAGGRATLRWEG